MVWKRWESFSLVPRHGYGSLARGEDIFSGGWPGGVELERQASLLPDDSGVFCADKTQSMTCRLELRKR